MYFFSTLLSHTLPPDALYPNLASKNDLSLSSIPTFANSATCSDLNQQQQDDDEAVTSAGQLEQSSRAGLEQGELSTTGKKSRQPRILRTDTYAQQNNKRRRPVAKVVKKRVRVAKGK